MRAKDFIEKHIDAILKKITMKSNFRNIIRKRAEKSKGYFVTLFLMKLYIYG